MLQSLQLWRGEREEREGKVMKRRGNEEKRRGERFVSPANGPEVWMGPDKHTQGCNWLLMCEAKIALLKLQCFFFFFLLEAEWFVKLL